MLSRLNVSARIEKTVAAVETSGKFWLVFAVLLAASTFTALGVVYTTYTSRHLLNSLQDLEKRRNRLNVEWNQLLLEQGSIVAQGKVEDTAITQLGMQVPDMNKVVVFRPGAGQESSRYIQGSGIQRD